MPITVAAPGLVQGNADRLEQFMKNFAGEVITAFERASKTTNRHQTRTISSGKSAAFPVLGRAAAAYLAPGNSLDDIRSNIPSTEKVIQIDGLLTSSQMITDIDEAMSHFDVSAPYSKAMGEALALAADGANIAEIAKLVVADAENLTGLGKGAIVAKTAASGTSLISATVGQLYLDMLFEMQYNFNKNSVPKSERVAYVAPDVIAALVNAKVLSNRDYSNSGSITEGTVERAAGFDIVMVPHLTAGGAATTDILQGSGHVFPVAYKDTTKIVAAHYSSIGILKLKDLGLEKARRAEFQADMMVAKYAMGHGGLRPEACQLGTLTLS